MAGSTETEKREAVRREYAALFATLSKLLFEADPIGINFEANTDEYEPEVGTILPRLQEANNEDDVTRIIHEEFCRWFDEKTAGPVDAYRELAANIWAEWKRYQGPADERRPGALK